MTNNIKTNKYRHNDAINNDSTFDTNIFNLSIGNKYTLPVVPVSLQGVKEHRARTVAGLTFLWDSRATDSMIKIKRTKQYERKMRSNKVEYGTVAGLY